MNTGQQLLEAIVASSLFTPKCADEVDRPHVVVWSSGAAEQLEAIAIKIIARKLREDADANDGLAGYVNPPSGNDFTAHGAALRIAANHLEGFQDL